MKSYLKSKFNVGDVLFELRYTPSNNYYTLRCLNKKEEMGYATFKLNGQTAWLYYICTHPKFQRRGVGFALLTVIEKFSLDNGASRIEGKFYPENEFAKLLYDKAGYAIEKDGYETLICKNIYQNASARVPEFEKV